MFPFSLYFSHLLNFHLEYTSKDALPQPAAPETPSCPLFFLAHKVHSHPHSSNPIMLCVLKQECWQASSSPNLLSLPKTHIEASFNSPPPNSTPYDSCCSNKHTRNTTDVPLKEQKTWQMPISQDFIRQYVRINWTVVLLVYRSSWLLSFLISFTNSGPNLINNHNTHQLKCVTAMKPDGLCW